jgi:flagellar motor switch protein FliM
MSEVLSQQEIDRLLSGINSGEIREDNISDILDHKEVYDYDFRRPTRVSKDQLKTFRTLHENFSELFGFYLASRLQTMVSIDLLAVDQLRYSEYVLSIANPCVVYIFDIKETQGRAVIELTPDLVLMIVERLLGGTGNKQMHQRGITQIEQRIIEPIIQKALESLSASWRPVQELNFSLWGFESNSDFVQIAPASEIVIVLSFELKIGEYTYLMNLCYPSFALEDVIAKLNVQFFSSNMTPQKREMNMAKITKQIQATQMEVKAILDRTEITIGELLDLEVGDVIFLDKRAGSEIPILVQDSLKFYGKPGTLDGKMAVKITGIADEETRMIKGEIKNG